jgi:sec-independent protein translocase protein TatC
MYIQISTYIAVIITMPFHILNFLVYFIQILYPKEFFFIMKLFLKFIFIYILTGIFNYYFLIPNILNFFLKFEQKNLYLITHFEAKFDEYFFLVLGFNLKLNLIFQIPILLDYLIFIKFISKNFVFYNKKMIFITIIILNTLLNPPEIYVQIIIFFYAIVFIELYIYFKFLLKNF